MDNVSVSSWGPGVSKWVSAGVVSLWVSIPAAVQTLLLLMLLDYVTGLLKAAQQKKLCSEEGLRGLRKKTATIIIMAAAYQLLKTLPPLPIDLGKTIAIAFAVNEAISVTENAAEIGVPIPPALLDLLLRAKKMTGRGVSAAKVREELDAPDPPAAA